MRIRITPNEKGNPPGKLADAELYFDSGPLASLKLIGFGIWESRSGTRRRNVTMPARTYTVNGERRSYALLRPTDDTARNLYGDHDPIRTAILDAFTAWETTGADTFEVPDAYADQDEPQTPPTAAQDDPRTTNAAPVTVTPPQPPIKFIDATPKPDLEPQTARPIFTTLAGRPITNPAPQTVTHVSKAEWDAAVKQATRDAQHQTEPPASRNTRADDRPTTAARRPVLDF